MLITLIQNSKNNIKLFILKVPHNSIKYPEEIIITHGTNQLIKLSKLLTIILKDEYFFHIYPY